MKSFNLLVLGGLDMKWFLIGYLSHVWKEVIMAYRGLGSCCMFFSRNLRVFPRLCNIWFKIKRLRCPAFDKFDTKEMSFYVLQKRETFGTQTCAPAPIVPWIRLCIFWGWRLNGERISGICIKFTWNTLNALDIFYNVITYEQRFVKCSQKSQSLKKPIS